MRMVRTQNSSMPQAWPQRVVLVAAIVAQAIQAGAGNARQRRVVLFGQTGGGVQIRRIPEGLRQLLINWRTLQRDRLRRKISHQLVTDIASKSSKHTHQHAIPLGEIPDSDPWHLSLLFSLI